MSNNLIQVCGFLFLSILVSCKTDYEKAVDAGLSSGIINDSLIFGMRMGQSRDDFFRICWDLNKKKIFTNGNGDNVKYIEPTDSTTFNKKKKDFLFYGIFDDKNIMRGMRMTYSYSVYDPSDTSLSADSLLVDVLSMYKEKYPGNEFIEMDLGMEKINAYVKIDGNRQILIYPKNLKDVAVKMEDLRFKKK